MGPAYTTSGEAQIPLPAVVQPRDPTTNDKISTLGSPYPNAQVWENSTTKSMFMYGGGGTWVPIGGAVSDVNTLTDGSGTAISPIGGTIIFPNDATSGVNTLNSGANNLAITISAPSTTQRGTVELTTDAEAIAGTDTTRAVTAEALKAKLGVQTAHGVALGEGTTSALGYTSAGTAGQILISGGPSADPTWTSGFTFGAVETTDATPTTLISFPCGAVAGVYTFDVKIAGFANVGAGTPLAIGYTIVGSVRTDGAAATFINMAVDSFEEGAMSACVGELTVSANNAIIQVTGVAAYTIDWVGQLTSVFADATT